MTAAQAAASRANGALSKGPVSEEGKAKSAANARRHGLSAKDFVLEDAEEQAQFELFFKELCFTHQAKAPLEVEAAHEMAVAMWRRRVCNALEKELVEAARQGLADLEEGGPGLPSLRTIHRYRARIARELKQAEAELRNLRLARAQAFAAEIAKARELSNRTMLAQLGDDLGQLGMQIFRESVAPKKPVQTNPAPIESQTETDQKELNRQQRRRAEKQAQRAARRQTRKHR